MKKAERIVTALLATAAVIGCASTAARPAAYPTLETMPVGLETRFALSALPPALREEATVYVLDPAKGYSPARNGTNGTACLVQRTDFALADFRDDLYFAVCFDAAGTNTYMKTIMDAAALRAQGSTPAALKKEIEARWKSKAYVPPSRPGLSYMIAPIMRTIGPPDLKVHTMAMPHYMFYAPGMTNQDIAAHPNLSDPGTLMYPFVVDQGTPEYNFIIQMVGATEKAQILARERRLVDDLCKYRQSLCMREHRRETGVWNR